MDGKCIFSSAGVWSCAVLGWLWVALYDIMMDRRNRYLTEAACSRNLKFPGCLLQVLGLALGCGSCEEMSSDVSCIEPSRRPDSICHCNSSLLNITNVRIWT